MTWLDLLYLPPAFLCNTAFPLGFDPVLIHFASQHSTTSAYIYAVIASAFAGVAAVVDVRTLSWFHRRASSKWPAWLPHWRGRRFYAWAFLFAMLPLPFAIVRFAILREPPEMFPYGLAVTLGRLPRYVLTVALWPVLGLPSGTAGILLGIGVFAAGLKLIRSGPRSG
jgi:membrane protein YqaA with SNARE-associated domain